MNEGQIKDIIDNIIKEVCNMAILDFRGINKNTIYNKLKEKNQLDDFLETINSPRADCIIFEILDEL